MANRLSSIFITIDTREQKGWSFEAEEKKPGKVQILGSEIGTLSAGDYAIKGHEDLIVIERKFGFAELFNNLMNKEGKERFERELEKLRSVKHKYLVVESSINDDIMCLSVPQYGKFGSGPPVSSIIKTLFEYSMEFGIAPIFAGSCGKKIAAQLFKTAARKYL